MPLSAVVLAGGMVRRPGLSRPRALLQLRERPLVSWTVERVSSVAPDVVVATAHGWAGELQRRLPERVRVVEDELVGFGPLGGLHAGARAARNPWVAVAPSEAPFSSPALYRLLLREARGHRGAIPFVGGTGMYLHAVYSREALIRKIERAIVRGEDEPAAALRGMGLARVGARKIARVDRERRSFVLLSSIAAVRAVEAGARP